MQNNQTHGPVSGGMFSRSLSMSSMNQTTANIINRKKNGSPVGFPSTLSAGNGGEQGTNASFRNSFNSTSAGTSIMATSNSSSNLSSRHSLNNDRISPIMSNGVGSGFNNSNVVYRDNGKGNMGGRRGLVGHVESVVPVTRPNSDTMQLSSSSDRYNSGNWNMGHNGNNTYSGAYVNGVNGFSRPSSALALGPNNVTGGGSSSNRSSLGYHLGGSASTPANDGSSETSSVDNLVRSLSFLDDDGDVGNFANALKNLKNMPSFHGQGNISSVSSATALPNRRIVSMISASNNGFGSGTAGSGNRPMSENIARGSASFTDLERLLWEESQRFNSSSSNNNNNANNPNNSKINISNNSNHGNPGNFDARSSNRNSTYSNTSNGSKGGGGCVNEFETLREELETILTWYEELTNVEKILVMYNLLLPMGSVPLSFLSKVIDDLLCMNQVDNGNAGCISNNNFTFSSSSRTAAGSVNNNASNANQQQLSSFDNLNHLINLHQQQQQQFLHRQGYTNNSNNNINNPSNPNAMNYYSNNGNNGNNCNNPTTTTTNQPFNNHQYHFSHSNSNNNNNVNSLNNNHIFGMTNNGINSRADILRQKLYRHTISVESPDVLSHVHAEKIINPVVPKMPYNNNTNGNNAMINADYCQMTSSFRGPNNNSNSSNSGNTNYNNNNVPTMRTSNRKSQNYDIISNSNRSSFSNSSGAYNRNSGGSGFYGNYYGNNAVSSGTANGSNSSINHNGIGQSNYGSVNRVRLASKEKGKIPESIDVRDLEDIPGWLRSLRLHKYTSIFSSMTWKQMIALTDEQLCDLGVSALGARRKLLKVFEKVLADTNGTQGRESRESTPMKQESNGNSLEEGDSFDDNNCSVAFNDDDDDKEKINKMNAKFDAKSSSSVVAAAAAESNEFEFEDNLMISNSITQSSTPNTLSLDGIDDDDEVEVEVDYGQDFGSSSITDEEVAGQLDNNPQIVANFQSSSSHTNVNANVNVNSSSLLTAE